MLFTLLVAHFLCLAQAQEHHYSQFKSYKSYNSKIYEKYGEYLTECGKGKYLNLCGECVSGKTEKDDEFGQDSCGICGGLETCNSQCSDELDILEAYEDQKGCTKLVSMSSNVLDIAESSNGSVWIFGEGINPDTVAEVDCNLRKGDSVVVEAASQVLENKIELSFALPGEGSYELACNTSVGVEFRQPLTVVDSRRLLPTALDKESVVTWEESQVTVEVSKMTGPAELLCFARADSGELLYSGWTSLVSGNSLVSTVVCPGFAVASPGVLDFGVAYSPAAVDSVKTLKLNAVAVPPEPLKAEFRPEKSEIVVTFSQNLQDVKDCQSIFDPNTMDLLGQSPNCYSAANEVRVLITGVALKDNTTLSFLDQAVKTKFSKAGGGGSIVVTISQASGSVRLEGDRKVCIGEQSRLVLSSDRQRVGPPVWTVAANNLSRISVGQRQRLNLMAWKAARASRKDPKALLINSTMMNPGVTYTVKAKTNDSTGTLSEVSAEVSLSGANETWMSLDGPTNADVQEYVFFQAAIHSCGSSLPPTKFKWQIKSDTHELDTSLVNGPLLKLDPGTLLANSVYNLKVEAFDGEKLVASETRELKTFLQKVNIRLQDAKIVVDNGHSIVIDASKSLELDPNSMKINWTCKKGYCYIPGKHKIPLNTLGSFSQPILSLPAKTLAVGRYLFSLEVSSGGTQLNEAVVEILVVSGQPPHLSTLSIEENKSEYLFLVDVSGIRQKCKLFWKVVPRIGYSHISIDQKNWMIEGTPIQPQSARMTLAIAKETLAPDSKLLLKAQADCGRAAQSYREFRFFVPDGFNDSRLEVEPLEGNALETEFAFRLFEKKSGQRVLYSFGYQDDGVFKPLYSGRSKEFRTYLGCCNFTTVAKVCRSKTNCYTVYGPIVRTSQPEYLNASVSRSLAMSFKDQIMSNNYEEALSQLKTVLPVLKNLGSPSYEQFSEDVQKVVVERIQAYTERLETDKKCIHEAVKMLDAASDVMASLQLSEESMTAVLHFRDLVHTSAKSLNEKFNEKKISKNLPPEPRPSGGNEFMIRHKRSLKGSEGRSLVATKSALRAAIRYSQLLGNTSKASLKERSKLLDSIIYYSIQSMQKDSLHQVDKLTKKRTGANNFPYSAELNLQRFKRGTEDTINQMDAVLKTTARSLKGLKNNTDAAVKEMTNLMNYTVEYSERMCNTVKQLQVVGSGQDMIRLGAVPVKPGEKEKVQFPLCSSACPNKTENLNVSMVDYNSATKSPEGVCVATAFVKDDLLTSIFTLNTTDKRLSNVYWLNVMRYQHGVVTNTYNLSSSTYRPEGMATIQIPVWSESKPEQIKLECHMFSPSGWNKTACVRMKDVNMDHLATSVQCQCPFPGFYSVFAVENLNRTESEVVVEGTTSTLVSIRSPTTIVSTLSTMIQVTTLSTKAVNAPTSATNETTTATNETTTAAIHTTIVTSKNKNPLEIVTTTSTKTPTSLSTSTTKLVEKNETFATTIGSNDSIPIGAPTTPITVTTAVTQNHDSRTVPNVFQPYKYSATFRINENYSEEVKDIKEKFEELIEDQLQEGFNLSESVTIDANNDKDKIAVTLRIPEKKIEEVGPSIARIREHLKNGTLLLKGLRGNTLNIPVQDIFLSQNSNAKPAITAVVTIIFIFLIILIGSVMAAFYLRNSREQRSLRITQDLHSDPPAPRYLRLHDSVSLDSGPSTPQNPEMESSLAVLTRPQRRGYETMESFSHFPGNI